MREIIIVGNPNVGKSTLFNSLTRSSVHTGNFHGVTVEEKSKVVRLSDVEYRITDLPGIYSLNCFSPEEEISKQKILQGEADILMLLDINSLRKNLYLCSQLMELGIDFKLYINNYDYFKKKKNKFDCKKLEQNLGKDIEIINAKKISFDEKFIKNFYKKDKKSEKNNKNCLKNEKNINFYNNLTKSTENIKIINKNINNKKMPIYLNKFEGLVKVKYPSLDKVKIVNAFNGIFDGLCQQEVSYIISIYPELIAARYGFVDSMISDSLILDKDFIYGYSRFDNFILNPFCMILGFFATFFLSIHLIFFLIGPLVSSMLESVICFIIIDPFMSLLSLVTSNEWVLGLFENGVFSSILTIIVFLPQVVLLFAFLTILEDSGIIARMSYVLDDSLSIFGLNGKAVYIILMGLGCNTMSCVACRNISNKNLRIKSAIINPYISCMARLPIFVIIASTFFGTGSYFIIVGLYLLGLIAALVGGKILDKTILPSFSGDFLLEFAPLKSIDIKHVLSVVKVNALDFIRRIFGIIFASGIIVWVLTHTTFTFSYTTQTADSILYLIADKLSFVLRPIGLDNAGVVCALVVGVLAKELIVSTFSLVNGVTSSAQLMTSLLLASSVISFTPASALSFLIFSLLYSPCVSTLSVIRREVGKKYMMIALFSEIIAAYGISWLVYSLLTEGLISFLVKMVIVAAVIVLVLVIKEAKKNIRKKGKSNDSKIINESKVNNECIDVYLDCSNIVNCGCNTKCVSDCKSCRK